MEGNALRIECDTYKKDDKWKQPSATDFQTG